MSVDPITLEIVKGAVSSTIREMEGLIERTAMSPVIKEKMDYFVGVYDTRGRIVDAFLSTSGPRIIDPVLREYPMEDMQPGDLYWYNDPHKSHGAIQHTGDMCFVAPVFYQGEITSFAVSFGHFWDIGGSVTGSLSPHATEIFHEGMLGSNLFIMPGGEIGLYNKNKTNALCKVGDASAEMSVLNPRPRTATAAAQTDVKLFTLDESQMNSILQ